MGVIELDVSCRLFSFLEDSVSCQSSLSDRHVYQTRLVKRAQQMRISSVCMCTGRYVMQICSEYNDARNTEKGVEIEVIWTFRGCLYPYMRNVRGPQSHNNDSFLVRLMDLSDWCLFCELVTVNKW